MIAGMQLFSIYRGVWETK